MLNAKCKKLQPIALLLSYLGDSPPIIVKIIFPNLVNSAFEKSVNVIMLNCFKTLALNLRVESGIFVVLDSVIKNEVNV
jgi:hypothetical protein